MNDGELTKLLHKNPEKGMRQLLAQYAGLVYTIVRGRLREFDNADVEDCVAEIFSNFYLSLDKYRPEVGSIKAWLCVIARNKTIDILRKNQIDRKIISLDDKSVGEQYPDDVSVEKEIENKHITEEVIEEIKKLGEPDSEIIMRKFYFCQPSREIAQALDMTVTNVDTRTHRALEKLRIVFGGELYEEL